MAELEDLVQQVKDAALREQLSDAVTHIKRHQRFGLVYERHIPEIAAMPGLPIHEGGLVSPRTSTELELLRVVSLADGEVVAEPIDGGETVSYAPDDLLPVQRFGDPIYPTLRSVGTLSRSDSRAFHPVINGENFHTLQLLSYLYQGQVDCIYMDPPYNTGAKDWKYNNRYVDTNDTWRHSKWLSFVEKRLRLARRLLKPDGVLVATIDEHEVHHLGMLLESVFPDAYRQMVTVVINPKGVTQGRFSRVEEYAFFCFLGDASVMGLGDDLLTPLTEDEELSDRPRWKGLLRSGTNAARRDRPNLFYPVLVDTTAGRIAGTGEPLPLDEAPQLDAVIDGYQTAWPIRRDGSLGNWGVGHLTFRALIEKGYAALGARDERRGTWGITYLSRRYQEQIESGILQVVGRDETTGVVDVRYSDPAARRTKTVWHRSSHDAGAYGTDLLRAFLQDGRRFPFPKSLYAVRDTLEALVGNRPSALILDFFAGSGTTLHATALLNEKDGGGRRCILVTNNEVDARQANDLAKAGMYPGDEEYESHGIFEAVTQPRIEAAFTGLKPSGEPIPGEYTGAGRRPYKDGFKENVEFFKLEYLDRDAIDLGVHLKDLLPLFWLRAGGRTSRPDEEEIDGFLIPEGAGFAVLVDELKALDFVSTVEGRDDIQDIYVVTDSAEAFAEIRAMFAPGRRISMLYRDYLRAFSSGVRHYH